ncbi:MAG: chondroitinase-B domain-containing protein [Planctomycetota bacterium]
MKHRPTAARSAAWLAVALAPLAAASDAAEIPVANAGQIAAAMATAQPGDVLVMQDGVWTDQVIDFAGLGTPAAPITLRPQSPGGVVLTGSSRLAISGDWLVADGLRFERGSLGASQHIVRFRGSLGDASNSRLTNSTFVDYNPADIDTRYFWVSLHGTDNRVDHNYFSGQNHSGVTVTVWRDGPTADRHRIDSNHFADRPAGNGNGFETIRVGTSTQSLSDSHTVVENNLFERVDGEIEIISSKSGRNTYRHNTFRESAGTLTLRHGNDAVVEGNFFLGEGKDASGGVRVVGERHTIVNNHFNDLDGRAGGAIALTVGVVDPEPGEYAQVRDALIAHNTIVDVNAAAIDFDSGFGSSGRTLLADDVTVVNNLISSTQDPLFSGVAGSGWAWAGNFAFGQSLGSAVGNLGVSVVDPQLTVGSDGLHRLSATSPAIDAAASAGGATPVEDIEGQPRSGVPDIGADEFSAASLARKPLKAGDVGPTWLALDDASDDGCDASVCLIQAEAFSSLLDPDEDSATWVVIPSADAIGGAAVAAPRGDRVDLPAEAHDAIAVYDVEFDAEGDYTAYVRARGFASSSDSLYTPDGFATDPDNTESISSDGVFRWERLSQTFAVSANHVGMPMEFRLAMREQLAQIDAIVFTTADSLSDTQLDALFDAVETVPGDYNGDGAVDAADYTRWRDSQGTADAAADGDGSGVVEAGDYAFWAARYGTAPPESLAAIVPEPSIAALVAMALTLQPREPGRRTPGASSVRSPSSAADRSSDR